MNADGNGKACIVVCYYDVARSINLSFTIFSPLVLTGPRCKIYNHGYLSQVNMYPWAEGQ